MSAEAVPAVSIVVCVYNGNRHLPRLVSYLERQTFKDFEAVFVVDVRSTDGSIENVKKLCDEHDNYIFIEQAEPSKLGGAKNLGIKGSKGRYIWFLDSDDTPSDTFLERMVAEKEKTGSDIALANFRYIDNQTLDEGEGCETISMTGKQALHARSLNIIPVTSWAMLYDRRLIEGSGLEFREMMAEDIIFSYISLSESEKVCFLTAPLYGYFYYNQDSFCNAHADERGRSEMISYIELSKIFSDGGSYLQNRFCIIGMRSMIHMTLPGFKQTINDPDLKKMIKEHGYTFTRIEHWGARHLPSLYHKLGNWYNRNYYTNVGKIYADDKKLKTLRKIVEN